MRSLGIAASLLVCGLAGTVEAAVPTMGFDEVRAGMTGVGRTVFAGTRVTSFDVEILGKIPNIGPEQDLILARCSGGPLAETGVLSGMSGSPVLIDGKLIGAVAYSWGFSKEAIAGITPIGEMLDIARSEGDAATPRVGSIEIDRAELARLGSAEAVRSFLEHDLWPASQRASGALPLSVPLSVAGVGAPGLSKIETVLARVGLQPVQAGSSGDNAMATPPLEPGSPIGVKLVRGDLEMTATGTVTWVDGDRVLAFGHPLFGLGSVDLPLTGAYVETLLPSLMQSSRIATPLGEVGALREDRASGILGHLASKPRLIPVRFQLTHPSRDEHDYSFDVADDPMLSPLLLYLSLNGIIASRERTFGSATVRLREGSVIKMAEGEDVALDNLFSGPQAFDYGTGIPAYILYLLMNNVWSRPQIAGVNLLLEYDEEPRTAQIRRVSLDRYRVHAGETVEAAIVLRPFRGREELITHSIPIPEETPPGTLDLRVGGAQSVSEAEQGNEPVLPRDLAQLIRLINQLRRNDQIYITATQADSGVVLEGTRLPNLPPSLASILLRPGGTGNQVRIPWRRVLEESVETRHAVEGSVEIALEVEAP